MNISSKQTITLSEQELYQAIEFYLKHAHDKTVSITSLSHLTREWTEGGGGMMEIDYSEPNGVRFECVEENL